MMRRLRRLLWLLLGVGCLWGLLMFSLQRLILFPRHLVEPQRDAGHGVHGLVRLSVPSPDGPVEGWYLPGDHATAQSPGPAVIFAHGNAELIEHWPAPLARYRKLGVNVLLPEYRGYGRSPGSPSQAAITEDFTRFYDLLIARPEVDRQRVIFHGRSLGGGVVCALATRRTPAAMILQSTFVSVRQMARRFLMPGFLVRDPFDNLGVVAELDRPLLVVHGRYDSLIPYRHAQQLSGAAKNGRLVTYDADHNNCPPDERAFWEEIERFLRTAGILG